jgi:hypothetical protein
MTTLNNRMSALRRSLCARNRLCYKYRAHKMLKKSPSIVLGSSKSSTYPRGYASGFDSPAALLDEFFEHLVDSVLSFQTCRPLNVPKGLYS